MFELFAGELFARQRVNMSINSILHGIAEFDFRPEFPDAVPMGLRNLAIDCWHRNALRRPTFAEVAVALRGAIEAASPEMATREAMKERSSGTLGRIRQLPALLVGAQDEAAILRMAMGELCAIMPAMAAATLATFTHLSDVDVQATQARSSVSSTAGGGNRASTAVVTGCACAAGRAAVLASRDRFR